MKTMELCFSIIGVVIVIIGWFVGYYFTNRQNVINKRKEIRVSYLINAWRKLESASNRDTNDYLKDFESSIADIQLFGSKKQIELSQKFAVELSEKGTADNLNLLIELRKDLRKELRLERVPDKFKFLRVTIK